MCVVNGPCIAGGIFTALCHDKVIMQDDKSSYLWLNEALAGLVVPFRFYNIIKTMVNGHAAQ